MQKEYAAYNWYKGKKYKVGVHIGGKIMREVVLFSLFKKILRWLYAEKYALFGEVTC